MKENMKESIKVSVFFSDAHFYKHCKKGRKEEREREIMNVVVVIPTVYGKYK